jgi:hypothetical protein
MSPSREGQHCMMVPFRDFCLASVSEETSQFLLRINKYIIFMRDDEEERSEVIKSDL